MMGWRMMEFMYLINTVSFLSIGFEKPDFEAGCICSFWFELKLSEKKANLQSQELVFVADLKNAQVCWNIALKNKLHELCRQYVFEGGSPFHSKTHPMINVFPTKNQQIMMFWVKSAQFTIGLLMPHPFRKNPRPSREKLFDLFLLILVQKVKIFRIQKSRFNAPPLSFRIDFSRRRFY